MQIRLCLAIVLIGWAAPLAAQTWGHYGGTLSGDRFVPGKLISPDTVGDLEPAWVFRTGDVANGDEYFGRKSTFKATPILIDDKLVVSSGFNRVYAIDPVTGAQQWQFDPQVDFSIGYSEMFTSRGVSAWVDPQADADNACACSVYLATLDARLIAVDARTGERCEQFGKRGEIDLTAGIRNFRRGDYSVTSPPTKLSRTCAAARVPPAKASATVTITTRQRECRKRAISCPYLVLGALEREHNVRGPAAL